MESSNNNINSIKSIEFNEDKYRKKLEDLSRGYAVINLDAVKNNMDSMHKHLAPGTKMLGVIKTNAYGHGSVQIGRVLEKLDYVEGYAVASAEEAMELRNAGLKKTILVLGYTFPYSFEDLVKNDISPAVFRKDSLDGLCEAAKKVGKKIKVHVKVDTGMGRIGIFPDDTGLEFVRDVLSRKELELTGIFTHFAKADEFDKTSVNKQISVFKAFTERIEKELGYRVPIRHCSNSAGILELKDANMDMVRAGITMYGLMPSDEVKVGDVELTAVMSLHSHISYIKTIHAGQSVSYGGLYTADKDTLVATVPLGYGDGYPRMLTGKGSVLIRGKRCPIIGRICMDQFMVDVSALDKVECGDKVVLLGRDGDECITAEEIGDLSGRFNYEFVCLITDRLPRVYLENESVFKSKVYRLDVE
ncbi:MAG: alanine racemase [Lachnospiraceae bacterium]|nr:alanine racemase [Lachnospiraceae bacterium]